MVLGPAVKTYPLVQPGMKTRTESFGTGFFSWAASDALKAATATATITAEFFIRSPSSIVRLSADRIKGQSGFGAT
jgi:hypothetical protein